MDHCGERNIDAHALLYAWFFDGFSDDDTDMAVWCKEYHPDLEYEQCVEKAGV